MDSSDVTGASDGQKLCVEDSHFGIQEFRFQQMVIDVRVCVLCIAMNHSYFFWIGTGNGTFDHLDVSMMTAVDSIPLSSVLMGNSSDTTGSAISKRLSMKLGSQVYVSYNLPSSQDMLIEAVERMIFKDVIPSIIAASAPAS